MFPFVNFIVLVLFIQSKAPFVAGTFALIVFIMKINMSIVELCVPCLLWNKERRM